MGWGGGGSLKINIERGLPKKRGLGQFADLRGAWQERGGGVFLRGARWHPNAHYVECQRSKEKN